MIFQKVDCWGDSLTFGARTYGCYPVFLGQLLRKQTGLEWLVRNRGVNGNTARDLWFRVSEQVEPQPDRHVACVVIGTNDAKACTPVATFAEYYEQVLVTLAAHGWTVVAAPIPLIVSRGRLPYTRQSEAHRDVLNKAIAKVVAARKVLMAPLELKPTDLCDGVHLTEDGNQRMAKAFADAILEL